MLKKLDHHNKFWYKNFEDIINFQHAHGGRIDVKRRENKQLSYWVENQRKFYLQFLWYEHTPPTSYCNSSVENIGFVWTVEKWSAGKGPTGKKKRYRMTKKREYAPLYRALW